jgi:hypothetical protein
MTRRRLLGAAGVGHNSTVGWSGKAMPTRLLISTVLLVGAHAAGNGVLAQGTAMPEWSLTEICRSDSDPAVCRLFEGEAWRSISGSWPVLPPEIRGTCVAETAKLPSPSYRLLADCLEEQHIRRNTRYATTTPAATPLPQREVPAPPSKAPAATEGTPTPPGFTPLNLPTTPPPVAAPSQP